MRALLFIILSASFALGCGPECIPAETRCAANVVEVCVADGLWATVQDCDHMWFEGPGIDWSCCETDLGSPFDYSVHTCRPIEHCASVDGR